jgi:hypothetical protein
LTIGTAAGVLINDSDPDRDALSVIAVNDTSANVGTPITLTSGATLTLNPDGSFTYIPLAGFTGKDSFDYTITDGQATATATVTITVNGDPATVSLTSSQAPSSLSQAVTFTATVTPGDSATDTPTGQVDFYDNGSFLGSVPLSNGVASFTLSSLGVGDHTITAVYDGDSLLHFPRKPKGEQAPSAEISSLGDGMAELPCPAAS